MELGINPVMPLDEDSIDMDNDMQSISSERNSTIPGDDSDTDDDSDGDDNDSEGSGECVCLYFYLFLLKLPQNGSQMDIFFT
jgi:hypothetical protein